MYVQNLGMGVVKTTGTSHADLRGSLTEVFRRDELLTVGVPDTDWKQSNLSVNNRGVFRGVHFSTAPEGQAKYVTCVAGALYDFAVDLRKGSSTFGNTVTVPLSFGESVYIPQGFAHGFVTVSDHTVVTYLLSSEYNPDTEHTISWNGLFDPFVYARAHEYTYDLLMSVRDEKAPTLHDYVAMRAPLPE